MKQTAIKLNELLVQLDQLRDRLDIEGKQQTIEVLQAQSAAPDFWDDGQKAQELLLELATVKKQVDMWQDLRSRITDSLELIEMGPDGMETDLREEAVAVTAEIEELAFQTLFAGEHDDKPIYFSIHAGSGGTESQDWAQMLQRMFERWCLRHNAKMELMDITMGDVAGIKSVSYRISGDHVHGWMKSEKGTHRLVRISPYDSSARRHTSFAKVEIWPDIAEEIEIEINKKDLEVKRFLASGAGGQHVQKNETAVRIKHIPSGIVVSCQNQRSLTQNMDSALGVLKVQLYELEQARQDQEVAELKGANVDAAWGNQIRSYVLHPYKMVKDHRTKHEVSNPSAVLDGALDGFMEAYLRYQLGETNNV